MKKITVFVLMLIIATSTFCQQTNPAPTLTKQDYLQKSKKQKTAAWIMLGGGATLVLTGIVIPKGDLVHQSWFFSEYENDGVKGAFGFTGIISMIGSIPFFIVSNKNNKRAMSVSFKNETAPLIQKSSFVFRAVPSLSLKLSL